MNKEQLAKLLKSEGVAGDAYSLEGGMRHDTICFSEISRGKVWEVYYTERGEKMFTKQFFSENEACEYFVHMLKESGLLEVDKSDGNKNLSES